MKIRLGNSKFNKIKSEKITKRLKKLFSNKCFLVFVPGAGI